jgi:hypothetical protein
MRAYGGDMTRHAIETAAKIHNVIRVIPILEKDHGPLLLGKILIEKLLFAERVHSYHCTIPFPPPESHPNFR